MTYGPIGEDAAWNVPRDVASVLQRGLDCFPDQVAIQARSGSLTYQQFDDVINRAAGALWRRGLRSGDRVAACLPNDFDVVVAFHATMRLGAIWVGIGPALAPPEKLNLLAHCRPTLLLGSREVVDELRGHSIDLPDVVTVSSGPEGIEWQDMLASSDSAPQIEVDPHAAAAIAYTSGTTGSPKGIVHSQHNLLLPGAVVVSRRGYGPDLRKGDCLPMTVLNLLVLSTLLTAQAGGRCVVMDRRDAVGVATWIRDARLTVWNGVPTQLWDLVRRDDVLRSDLRTLEDVWCGGAHCPDDLREAFAAKFGRAIRATYGLTEIPTIVAMDPPGKDRQAESSGQTLPHLLVTVRDEDGGEVARGQVGELCVSAQSSGPWARQWTPMVGTWQVDHVQRVTSDEVRTGDLGTVHSSGWLTVVDRRKSMILRGGANVYPAEVERVLVAHPAIRGVAVFGVEDDRLGQRVAALVEVDADGPPVTAPELAEYCSSQLARYKVPQSWGFVTELPRNAMGKVVRHGLERLLPPVEQPEESNA